MPAELGETNDPDELIPGNPDSVYTTFGALIEYASLLEEAGNGLKSIDTTAGWSGAAADAFREVYQGQPSRWLQAGDAFKATATAMSNYGATLGWAQQVAADAIDTWNSGKQNHLAATEMLASARSQLASAASAAAETVTKAAKLAPPAPGFWSQVGSFFGDAWHGTEHAAETGFGDTVDALASVGNAAVHDPGGVAAAIGGTALAGISAGGEGLGVALDATGVGAVAGVPLNVASAAGIATGVGIAGAGVTSIAVDAAGQDRVSIMQARAKGGSGGGGSGDDSPTVREILQGRRGSIRQAPLPKGSPSWDDIQDMPIDEVQEAANNNVPGFRTIAKLLKDGRFKK